MMGKWEEEEPVRRRREYIRREPEPYCDMRAEEERVSGGCGNEGPHWSQVVWEAEGQLGKHLWTWPLLGPLKDTSGQGVLSRWLMRRWS